MFSVVIPLYNKELSVKNTIDSVLNQTFTEFEIVIVNDGSTDKSVEVVEQINDSRIRIIHQQNQGVSAARNRGIKEAKFEWVAFLDGDDLWMENHLQTIKKMQKVFQNYNIYVTSFRTTKGVERIGNIEENEFYLIEDYFAAYIKQQNLVWTSTVVLNKRCFNKVEGFNIKYKFGEDIDLWARLNKHFHIVKANTITAVYRQEAENRSDKKGYKLESSFLNTIDFRSLKNDSEKEFYKFWVLRKIKRFLLDKDFRNAFILIKKYGRYLVNINI